MRDRLSSLRSLSGTSGQQEEVNSTESVREEEEEEEEEEAQLEPPAEEHRSSRDVEQVLEQALEVRREVQLLRLDVRRLRDQNVRLLSGPPCASSSSSSSSSSRELWQQESNGIAGGIKTRAQGALTSLRRMDARAKQLEEELGVNSAAARIARTQYACLSNGLRDAMADYNEAEMSHREACKAHIQRQMEIVGREVDLEEIEDMLEDGGGQWSVFTQDLTRASEGKTARSALGQIERRHQELRELEGRVRSVHEVFLDAALLVEEQRPMMDAIQTSVQYTEVATGDALDRIVTAKKHDRSNPFKKLFFRKR